MQMHPISPPLDENQDGKWKVLPVYETIVSQLMFVLFFETVQPESQHTINQRHYFF